MTYTILRGGKVVNNDGENIPVIDDPEMVSIVAEREAAKGQEKFWRERVKALEQQLRELGAPDRAAYGGIVLATQQATRYERDAAALSDYLYDNPAEPDDLLALIAAATGFKRDANLSASMRAVLDMMTETKHSPYFVSSIAASAEKRDPWEGVE